MAWYSTGMGMRGPKPGTLRNRPRDPQGRLLAVPCETGETGQPISIITRHWTPEEMAQALRDSYGLKSVVQDKLGCSLSTVDHYIAEYEQVSTALAEVASKLIDIAEKSLYAAVAKREPWAVCFFLKTRGKKRGYIERLEHVGADDAPPIKHAVLTIDAKTWTEAIRALVDAGAIDATPAVVRTDPARSNGQAVGLPGA